MEEPVRILSGNKEQLSNSRAAEFWRAKFAPFSAAKNEITGERKLLKLYFGPGLGLLPLGKSSYASARVFTT